VRAIFLKISWRIRERARSPLAGDPMRERMHKATSSLHWQRFGGVHGTILSAGGRNQHDWINMDFHGPGDPGCASVCWTETRDLCGLALQGRRQLEDELVGLLCSWAARWYQRGCLKHNHARLIAAHERIRSWPQQRARFPLLTPQDARLWSLVSAGVAPLVLSIRSDGFCMAES
jgi:hypothetical protein